MKQQHRIWITEGKIVLPDAIVNGSLFIENGQIKKIIEGSPAPSELAAADEMKSHQSYIMPGLIDLHCDAIEKEIEPRPNALFPLEFSLNELEKKLAASGITTMYHSLSIGVGLSLRGIERTLELIDKIREKSKRQAMIHHRIHVRYELTDFDSLPLIRQLLKESKIDYFSFMNHAPGIGQYRKPGAFENYVMKNQGISLKEVEKIVEDVRKKQQDIDWTAIRELCTLMQKHGIPIASHDDDSVNQVNHSKHLGAVICEFPLTIEAAAHAQSQDMIICAGAPNLLRGQSHDGNLGAREALKAGACDVICSDYMPTSLLPALFQAHEEGFSLPEAVKLATLHPAEAMSIHHKAGSITTGKTADLIWVKEKGYPDGYPSVYRTMIGGQMVYEANERIRHTMND